MVILKAGKLEESTHGATTQKLITSLNRGGLWSITMPAQRIFVKIEKHFKLLTPNINLQGINLSGITVKPRFNEPRYNEDPVITNNI